MHTTQLSQEGDCCGVKYHQARAPFGGKIHDTGGCMETMHAAVTRPVSLLLSCCWENGYLLPGLELDALQTSANSSSVTETCTACTQMAVWYTGVTMAVPDRQMLQSRVVMSDHSDSVLYRRLTPMLEQWTRNKYRSIIPIYLYLLKPTTSSQTASSSETGFKTPR